METRLDTSKLSDVKKTISKLFGIREKTSHGIALPENSDVKADRISYGTIKNAVLEAERKKAEAISIYKQHAFLV